MSNETSTDPHLTDETGAQPEANGKPTKGKKSKGAKAGKAASQAPAASPAPAATDEDLVPTAPTVAEEETLPDYVPMAPIQRRRVPRWAIVAACLVGVALIVTTALAVIQWSRANDLENDVDAAQSAELDRRNAADVANRFTVALLTYDFNNLEASRDAVIEVSTPEFAEKYGPAFQQGLQPVLAQTESIATASIRTVYVGDTTADSANVITVADQTVQSNIQELKKIGSYFKVELKKLDGTWKVAAVTVLGVEGTEESENSPDGATETTTTTAPPSG